MKVLLVDGAQIAYTPSSLLAEPLGGSQSAMLMVAEGLSRHGLEIFVSGRHFPDGMSQRGYSCVQWNPSQPSRLPRADVVVSLNRLMSKQFIARQFGPDCRYLHWHQNDARSSYGAKFAEAAIWQHVDKFIFVSRYQAGDFISRFGIPSSRMAVIGNPVPECFLSLFPEDVPILAAKDPELLIYASAPNRGLDNLIQTIFPEMRKRRPRLRLEVYSGFYLDQGIMYGAAPDQESAPDFEELLREAARTPGVAVSRGLPKQELAARLGQAAMLCYPCTFRETFCSTVREAMAAGCIVSTTSIGALGETAAGFALLTTLGPLGEINLGAFTRMTLNALEERDASPGVWEQRLRNQINHVRETSAPGVIAKAWHDVLQAA